MPVISLDWIANCCAWSWRRLTTSASQVWWWARRPGVQVSRMRASQQPGESFGGRHAS